MPSQDPRLPFVLPSSSMNRGEAFSSNNASATMSANAFGLSSAASVTNPPASGHMNDSSNNSNIGSVDNNAIAVSSGVGTNNNSSNITNNTKKGSNNTKNQNNTASGQSFAATSASSDTADIPDNRDGIADLSKVKLSTMPPASAGGPLNYSIQRMNSSSSLNKASSQSIDSAMKSSGAEDSSIGNKNLSKPSKKVLYNLSTLCIVNV